MTDPAPPYRHRLSRVRGARKPQGCIVVSRPSAWGNPWKAEAVDGVGWCCTDTRTGLIVQARDRADAHDLAVAHYRAWFPQDPARLARARATLRGHCLACWCPPDVACHADYLLEVSNG